MVKRFLTERSTTAPRASRHAPVGARAHRISTASPPHAVGGEVASIPCPVRNLRAGIKLAA
jgi:hypothetical protein